MIKLSFLLLMSSFAALVGCDRAPTLPTDISLMDEHSRAFLVWAAKGVKGRTVIHIDAHDDYRFIDDEKIRETQSLLERKQTELIGKRLDSGADELMNMGNYLYAAYRTGMITEIYWIYTSESMKNDRMLPWVKEMLMAKGYPREEIQNTFGLRNGLIKGTIYGIPFTVCVLEDLPTFRDPVLLDIDIDFFVNDIRQAPPKTLVSSIKKFREDMLKAKLKFDIATIAFSLNLDFTPLEYKHLGYAVKRLLENPSEELTSEGWKSFMLLSEADMHYRNGQVQTSIDTLLKVLRANPADSAAHYYLAYLHTLSGQYKSALPHAVEAAKEDQDYSRGLAHLANLISEKDYNAAMTFLNKAEEMAPGSSHAAKVRGDIYFNQGLYQKALEQYLRVNDGSVAIIMYIGDTYMMMRDYRNALQYYRSGIELIERSAFMKTADFSLSLLLLGKYYEHIGKDRSAAKKYYDLFLNIPRNSEEQKAAYAEVRKKSRLY
ncbi:MAG: tetratricopeptide repeat protein [Nitrospirae bacterium]|nr:tetratricopeptide repeat protein [Nitrospirota bacterium]